MPIVHRDDHPYTGPLSMVDAPRRRTCWRIAVATILVIFGAFGLLGSLPAKTALRGGR